MDTLETPNLTRGKKAHLLKMTMRDIYKKETGKPLPKVLENEALKAAGLLKKPGWM